MSKVNDNLLVRGARGNIGKQFVYRKRGDDTFIARMPRINKNAIPTDKQTQKRDLFSDAIDYASGVVASPDLKKEYEKKLTPGKTAYNLAVRDFLKSPVVKKIDVANYKGTVGSIIVVNAKDDFRVTQVKVSIHSSAGDLVEEGNAILNPVKRRLWNYTTTQNNPTLTGSVISATATDLPGNSGSLEMTV